MNRIIYTTPEGGVAVIIPTESAALALKDVPEGVPYEIVEDDAIPSDRTFRNAWVMGDCCIDHDLDRCRAILHVSYIGGVDANGKPLDNRTDAQKAALYFFVSGWAAKYPTAKIMGHRDFSRDLNRDGIIQPSEWAKACPSFDVKSWCEQVGLKHNR